MAESLFKLHSNHTTIRTEILAGITTFLTMSYIIFVNPQILNEAGMNLGAVFVATCLVAAIGSFLTGFMANYPIAVAPGMALNVYFSYIIVQGLGHSWQSALGAVFISGVIFFLLTVTKIRRWIVESIPESLNIGIAIGIGLFIALLALKSGGIVKANPKTFMTLGDVTSLPVLLFFSGFCLIVILDHLNVSGAIMIGVLVIAVIGILLGTSHFHGIFSLPPSLKSTWLALNVQDTIHLDGLSVIFAFLLVALFDSTGTLVGVLHEKQFPNDGKKTERISRALLADSMTTIAGSVLGTSSTSPFIESASGIRAGGRTGLTAVTVGALFLFALFLSPLAKAIPSYAVGPALLYVGILMIKNVTYLNGDDFSEFVPSVITAIMTPFSFSIADGLGLGIISYILIKLFCGKSKDLNIVLIILAAIFVVYFIFRPQL